jgi:hypothetical protein
MPRNRVDCGRVSQVYLGLAFLPPMKFERIHEYLMTTVVLIVGLFAAFFCGKLSGAGQFNLLASFLAFAVLMFLSLTLRSGMWAAVLLAWHLSGQIPLLPVPFSVRDLVVLSVAGMFIIFVALRIVKIKPRIDALDLWMFLTLIYVASTFLRNPIGTWSMGSQIVGGRKYFTVFIAVLAYWVLARSWCRPRSAKWLPAAVASVIFFEGVLTFLCNRFWGLAAVLGQLYTGFAVDTKLTSADMGFVDDRDARQTALVGPGQTLIYGLVSYFRPLTLINPVFIFRFLFFLLGIIFVFYSGFRSVFLSVLLAFLMSSYVRRGWSDVIRICAAVVPILLVIGFSQGTVFNLPLPVQRALSFVPGNWSIEAKEDARSSTEWRVEIWKDALRTNKYIDNRWLGDGFGTSAARMQRVMSLQAMPNLSTRESQENAAVVGDFHSGPISGIRFVGYFGLVLFYLLILQAARVAMRTVRAAMGTPYQTLALFVAFPVVLRPFLFTFVFGAYPDDLAETILAVGMLKVLNNSLDKWKAEEKPPAMAGENRITKRARGSVHAWQPTGIAVGLKPQPMGKLSRGVSESP